MLDNTRIIDARLHHMRLRNLSATTLTVNNDCLHRLARWLEPTLLLEATADDMLAWAAHIQRLAPRSRYAELSRVHCFYAWCLRSGYIDTDPTLDVPRPKVPRAIPRPISERRLFEALADAPDDVYAFLMLAAFAGLRRSEIASLTRDRIREDDTPPVIVVTGKGSKDRVVPLHPSVLDALRRYGMPLRGAIFRRRDGQHGPVTGANVGQLTNRYLHALGFPETIHTLRHRAITSVYRASKDIRVAQTFAGHSSPQTTAGYAAYCPDRLVDAVLAIPA